LIRPDIVNNEHLMMVRANMEPGRSHPFHNHPTREEVIYIISGKAEQWVGKEKRLLGPGDTAFIPMGEVHGTWNAGDETLVFLAILSPAKADEPGIVDKSQEEPWKSLRPA
jgi:quercetin dioxygenase-like cupin family protein